jgi:cytochrome c oxidase subunit I+III
MTSQQGGIENGRLGMLLFLGSDAMAVSSMIGAYLVLRIGGSVRGLSMDPFWALPILTAVLTAALLWPALRLPRSTRPALQLVSLGLIGLAIVACGAAQVLHFQANGLALKRDAFAAIFYLLLGCQVLHAAAGAVAAFVSLGGASRVAKENLRSYWIFFTALSAVFFPLLYLV